MARSAPLVGLLGLYMSACYRGGSEPEDLPEDDPVDNRAPLGTCVDTTDYFQEKVWTPILKTKCYACHNESGAAAGTSFVLRGEDWPGYLEANEHTMENLVSFEVRIDEEQTLPLLLAKPSGQTEHGGNQVIDPDGDEYAAISEMLRRFGSPTICNDERHLANFFKQIELLDEEQTLRKATLLLASRLPTPEEYEAVRGQGIESLSPILDAVMHEDAFYERLREMVNDRLHTDAFLYENAAIDTIDEDMFPNARWFDALPEDMIAENRSQTNKAITREPLEMVVHVVRQDRPFTDALLADATMVNPWSANSYGVDLGLFADPTNPDEWIEVDFEDMPQSGLLTTSVYLNKYPTTPTNRNRHRSRMLQDFFLGIDVLKLASRPINITEVVGHNPTLNDAHCNVCHVNVDPLAGAFMNWDEEGHYRPMGGWNGDMVAPGFEEEQVDPEAYDEALRWTMERVLVDPKFPLGAVRFFFEPVVGQAPLTEPTEPDDQDYLARIRASEAQTWKLKQIADQFVADGYEVRTIIEQLIFSEYFRAIGYEGEGAMDPQRRLELAEMGPARVLPPEALSRKLIATTGYRWTKNGADALRNPGVYMYFYGGIDSLSVTERLSDMNGVMANIAERMSVEVSCKVTGLDFAKPPAERLLFPYVELADVPYAPGDGSELAADAIRNNIVYLHEHLLGEVLEPDDPEIERTFQVFMDVWEDGTNGMMNPVDPYPTAVPTPCQTTEDPELGPLPPESVLVEDPNFTARAWMAVLSYLLADFRYLYE